MARILVVDDFADICKLLVHVLNWAGHQTTCVTNGEDALAYLRRTRPDLIVIDVMMAGIGGFDLLGRIRADGHTRAVPVIMYSVHDEDEYRQRALSMGAQAYLVKSALHLDSLVTLVRKVVAAR